MSPEIAALEMRQPGPEVREAFEELAEVALIRYDQDEELVQIVNFFKFNAPTSRKHLAGPLRIINDALPQSPVRDAAAAELVIAMYERANKWGSEVEAKGAFLHEASILVKNMKLQDILCSPEFGLDDDYLIALSIALLIDVSIQEQGQDQEHNKTKTTDTTRPRTQQDHGAKAPKMRQSAGSPPSLPANCSQSGNRNVSEETREIIASLGRKVKGQK